MTPAKKHRYRHQRNSRCTAKNLEHLKNRLADNETSMFMFYARYYVRYREKTYKEFLDLLHYWEVWTSDMKRAFNDFWEVSE